MKMILRFTSLALTLLLPAITYAGSETRDYYSEPGINPYKSLSEHPNESISTFNGSLALSYTDILVPGNGGLDIKINRFYNGPISSTPLNSPYGFGWSMHFGRIVVPSSGSPADVFAKLCQSSPASDLITSADNPSIEFADGARELLFLDNVKFSTVPQLITKSRIRAECFPEGEPNKGSTGMIVTALDGTRYTMNEFEQISNDSGASFFNFFYTTRIEDTNGNWINIQYRATGTHKVIDNITTNDGREVRYQYSNEGTAQLGLSSIEVVNSTVANQIWSYEYDTYLNFNLLEKVTRPDGSEWEYEYDDSTDVSLLPLLDEISYPWGGEIKYTYKLHDFNPGLGIQRKPVVATKEVKDEIIRNGSKVDIEGLWTFDYSQGLDSNGNGIIEDGEHDKTTVTTPTAVYTYEHIGVYTSAASLNLWAVGLPVYVTVEDKQGTFLQRTANSWAFQTISNEQYTRGIGVRNDLRTNAPILTSKSVFRDGVNYFTNYSNHNAYGKPETVITTSNIANNSKQIDYSYFIDSERNIVKQEDEAILNVGTIDRTYDANGNVQSISKFGVTTNYTYYPTGDVNTETDARLNTTTYSNYYRGSAQQIDYPENVTVYRTINDSGTLKNETDGRGNTTQYSYDELNRLSGINYPINDSVSINYENATPDLPWRPMSRTLLRGQYKEKVTFDGFGRVNKTIRVDRSTGERIVTRKEYDVLGRTVFESYPNSQKGTSTSYDTLDRVVKIDNINDTFSSYAYGPGNTATVTDENGNTTKLLYRSYGSPDSEKVVSRIDKPEANILTSMTHNKLGQLVTAWQGFSDGTQGYTRQYGYDTRNYLTTVTNPETGITTYGRDALGNMSSKQVGSSALTTYTYDNLNRLKFIDYPNTTEDVTYSYDANSNVKSITNATSAIAYLYDSNDNMYFEQVGIKGQTYTTSYAFNALDNLDNITYHSGRLVSYTPDAFGRATTAEPFINSVTYHPNSQVKQMQYANGQVSTSKLNQRRWVKSLSVTDGTINVMDLLYKYDKKGNVKNITDNLDATYTRRLRYDAADRLEVANGQWGRTKFVYDSFGNIRKKKVNGIATNFFYNNNQLLGTSGVFTNVMGYDDYGNITTNGRHDFIYDDAGNMLLSKQVSIPGSPSLNSTSYKYDGNNMRVIRSRYPKERHYLFAANGNQLGEYDPISGYLKEHIYLGSNRIASAEDTPAPPPPPTAPVAKAGADISVAQDASATLDGTQSTPNTGVTYDWVQTTGPTVTLNGANTATPTFVASTGFYAAVLKFSLIVTNQTNISSIDSVTVNVTILDTDNDGLPDNFEVASFGDLTQTGTSDFDNDGITNLEEWQKRSDPTVVNELDTTVGFFARPGDKQNTIYWVKDALIQNYDLYWSTSPGVTPQNSTLVNNASSPYVHTGLTNGQTYYYILVAKSACCESIAPEQKVTTGQSGWSDASLLGGGGSFIMNKAGQGILTWAEPTANSVQLFARRFDPTQGWLAAEKYAEGNFVLNSYRTPDGGYIVDGVDIDEDGDVVILYRDIAQAYDDPTNMYILENNVNTGWSTPNLIGSNIAEFSNTQIDFVDNDYAVIIWQETRDLNTELKLAEYRKGLGISAISVIESGENSGNINLNYAFNSDAKGNALLVWKVSKSGIGITIEDKVKARRYNAALGWSNTEIILDDDSVNQVNPQCGRSLSGNRTVSATQNGYSVLFGGECLATYTNNKWNKEVISTDESGMLFNSNSVHAIYGGANELFLSKSGTAYFHTVYFNDFTLGYLTHKTRQDISWASPAYTESPYVEGQLWEGRLSISGGNNQTMQEDISGNLLMAVNHHVFAYSETNGMRMPVIPDIDNASTASVVDLSMDDTGNGILIRRLLDGYGRFPVTRKGIFANYYTHIAGSPTANAGPSRKITTGQTVTLDGTGSSDANGTIISYNWEQVGSPFGFVPVTITNANSATPSVTLQESSAFKLTVVDDQGLIQTDSVIIYVFDPLAVENNIANAGSNQTVSEGDLVTFDASASTPVSAYFWRQVSGPTVYLANPYAVTTTFFAPQVSADTPILFELLISNGDDFAPGSLSKSPVTVTVQDYTLPNLAPVVNAGADQFAATNTNTGNVFTLAGNVSDADGTVTQYRWKQIEGPRVRLNNSNGMTPDFTAYPSLEFGSSITYVFELIATDDHAVTTRDTVSITYENRVTAPDPTGAISGSVTNAYILNGFKFYEVTLSSNTPGAIINFGFDVLSPQLSQIPFGVNNPPYTANYMTVVNGLNYDQTYSIPILIQLGENQSDNLVIRAQSIAPDGVTLSTPITIWPTGL